MKFFKKYYAQYLTSLVIVALVLTISNIGVLTSYAAALTSLSDTMSNETAAATATSTIKFTTPTGIAVNQTFVVTFPSGFNFGSKTISTITMSYGATTGLENALTLAASATGANWGAVLSGTNQVVLTLTAPSSSNTIPAGNVVVLTYQSPNSVNPSAGSYTITLGGGASTAADSGSVTVPILTNNQVSVSATVPQSLTFSLSTTTVALGILSASASTSASHTMTLGTNGNSGASVTVNGTTLTYGTTTIAACSAGCTSTVGTAQFGINLAANTSPSIGAAPTGSAPIATAGTGYGTANNFRFVTGETIATAAVPINTTTLTVSYLANIAALTSAGIYTTSLTYNATANF